MVGDTPPTARLAPEAPKPSNETRSMLPVQSEAFTTVTDVDQDLSKTNGAADLSSVIDIRGFVQGLNELRDEVSEELHFDKVAVGSTLAATTGLSIGYVLWLLRGEVLLSSLLASLPAWRLIDPLPVLAYLNKAGIDESEADDSIESAIAKGGGRSAEARGKAERSSNSVTWRIVTESRS
jgi:hypothetical protein